MQKNKRSNQQLINVIFARTLLAGLVVFEFLNMIGVLHFEIDFSWLGLMLTVIVAWSLLELVNYWLTKRTGKGIAGWVYLVTTFAIYIDGLGDINGWYGGYIHYDQMAHFIGGMTVAGVIGYVILRIEQSGQIKFTSTIFFLTVLSMTMALGSLYEIEEYLEDYFRGTNRLGDGPDTVNDLLLNTIGALVALSIILYVRRRNTSNKRAKKIHHNS